MKVNGQHTRTIWVEPDGVAVGTIDQTLLPFRYATIRLETVADAADAIKSMRVRGAPLIGAVAAYGIALGAKQFVGMDIADFEDEIAYISEVLAKTRPTAVNLFWAI